MAGVTLSVPRGREHARDRVEPARQVGKSFNFPRSPGEGGEATLFRHSGFIDFVNSLVRKRVLFARRWGREGKKGRKTEVEFPMPDEIHSSSREVKANSENNF